MLPPTKFFSKKANLCICSSILVTEILYYCIRSGYHKPSHLNDTLILVIFHNCMQM